MQNVNNNVSLKAHTTSAAPVAETKAVKSNGRLIEPIAINIDATRGWANKPTTAQNRFVAGIQKVAYLAMATLSFVFESFRNAFAALALNPGIYLINGLFGSKGKDAEAPVAPPAQQKTENAQEKKETIVELAPPRSRAQKLKQGASYYASAIATKIVNVFHAVKAHPYKSAGIAAGVVGMAAGGYYAHTAGYTTSAATLAGNLASAGKDHVVNAASATATFVADTAVAGKDHVVNAASATASYVSDTASSLYGKAAGLFGRYGN